MFTEEIRQKILKRDKSECQLSKRFGISELSGEVCRGRLEVHHKTYKTERVKDGITVCKRCHDIITSAVRQIRFDNREIEVKDVKRNTLKLLKERKDEDIKVQDYRRNTPGYA